MNQSSKKHSEIIDTQSADAVIKFAQYLSNLTSGQDAWHDTGKAIISFFGADLVAVGWRSEDGGIEIRHWFEADRIIMKDGDTENLKTAVRQGMAATLVFNFLEVDTLKCDQPLSVVYLPVELENEEPVVIMIGHRTNEPLAKQRIDLYLAAARLAGSVASRLRSQRELDGYRKNLEELVHERTAELTAVNRRLQDEVDHRMAAESSARENEERLQLVLQSAGLGSFDWWVKKDKIVHSRRTREILGYQYGEIGTRTRDWEALLHPEDKERALDDLDSLLTGTTTYFELENRFRHRGGEWVWVLIKGKVIEQDPAGAPIRICGTLRDVTARKAAKAEKKRLQSRLAHAQKMEAVGVLADGIAHDFNNLLQMISGYTQLLMMDRNQDDPATAGLNRIQQATDRAAELVKRLMLFSRKSDASAKTLSLNQEIERGRVVLMRTLPKMINIELDLDDHLWPVMADPIEMEQLLLNLGSNAADAMPEGGTIIIRTRNDHVDSSISDGGPDLKPGRYVRLTFSDSGQGMDQETLSHIFEPFYTTKDIGKGTGLGLASVYGIIQSHNGYISCQSELGRGTVFDIHLPVADEL